MRVLIAGTGAVGGYYGARLAAAGEDVTFLARGATLAALRARGLRVRSIDGDLALPRVTATDTLDGAPPADVVLVAVKSYDTRAVAAAIAPVVGGGTIVLSLQNGIENESLLASVLRLPPLVGAMTHIGAEVVEPGLIRHDAEATIFFGETHGRGSSRVQALAALFGAAGVTFHLAHDILLRLWDKLAWNAAHNAVTALAGATVGAVMRRPAARDVVRRAMHEVVAVARAQGIGLDPARVEPTLAFSRDHMPELRTSMLQDRERGRRLEHEALNGVVVRLGEALGVPTPVNRTLHGLLAAIDPGSSAA